MPHNHEVDYLRRPANLQRSIMQRVCVAQSDLSHEAFPPRQSEGNREKTLRETQLARAHFGALYGTTSDAHGRIVIYSKRPYAVRVFAPSELVAASEYAVAQSLHCDTYHLVNLVSPKSVDAILARKGRGRASELSSVVAFVCEIDVESGCHKEQGYPTQEAALSALAQMPVRPSIVNLSGPPHGGLHVYWLLDTPAGVTDAATRRKIQGLSRAWQALLRSKLSPARLDSTFDLVRVLRVPGCLNHKYGVCTSLLAFHPERRYRLSDFEGHVDLEPLATVISPPGSPKVRGPRRVQRCLLYLEHVPDAVAVHGHDRTFRAACECFRFGLSRDEARRVLSWFNEAKTPPDDKWTDQQLEHKLQDAYEAVCQAGQFGVRLR